MKSVAGRVKTNIVHLMVVVVVVVILLCICSLFTSCPAFAAEGRPGRPGRTTGRRGAVRVLGGRSVRP